MKGNVMSHTLKSALLRFGRSMLYAAIAAGVTFLVAHGQEALSGVGISGAVLAMIWPTISAILLAVDKYVRSKKEE